MLLCEILDPSTSSQQTLTSDKKEGTMPSMHTPPLSAEQQVRFEEFFDAVLGLLGPQFEGERDTFMNAPLRYSQSAIFPVDRTMSRNAIRAHISRALGTMGSTEGKGVYTVDRFVVNSVPNPDHFCIKLMNARRGGYVITFDLC